MGKISKKYIGGDQVGSVQLELENNLALRAKAADGLSSQDLLELDPSNLLQILKQPYLPGNASDALQAVPKQQVLLLDGSQSMSGALNMGSQLISSLADPLSDSDAANKKYVDDATASLVNKANTNLDNLVAPTSIPNGVHLRSLSTDQNFGFRLITADQTTSVSGRVDVRSGTTEGAFNSGAVAILPGLNSNANGATSDTIVTGSGLLRSGSIIGGTQGSTNQILMSSGSVSGSVSGNTGAAYLESGINYGTGNTGIVRAVTGFQVGTGNSGNFFAGTGKAGNGVSGYAFLTTGAIDAFSGFDNTFSNSNTGAFYATSGGIYNPSGANSGNTGLASFSSGSIEASGATGTTGDANVASGGHTGLGATGLAQLQSGIISNALSSAETGFAQIRSGNNAGSGKSGDVYIASGDNSGTGNSGNINLNVGSVVSGSRGGISLNGSYVNVFSSIYLQSGWTDIKSSDSATTSGGVGLKSGDAESGDSGVIALGSGNSVSGAAGNVYIFSGVGSGSVRGIVQIEASKLNILNTYIDMNSQKIVNLQDPTAAQDAATKAYVDAQISAGTDFHKQAITLSATDISNQYVDLSIQAIAQSCSVFVGERVALFESLDYTVSVVGGVTRLSFAGPSAAGGAEELVEDQVLYIQCVIE